MDKTKSSECYRYNFMMMLVCEWAYFKMKFSYTVLKFSPSLTSKMMNILQQQFPTYNNYNRMSKKLSWSLLILFFTFDAAYSFYAVSYLGAHEANWVIAPFVEKYPILYFLCIPLLVFIMLLVVRFLVYGVVKLSVFNKVSKEKIEKYILASLVIYWFVANSSLNIAYIFSFRGQSEVWYLTTLLGLFIGIIYFFINIRRYSHVEKL